MSKKLMVAIGIIVGIVLLICIQPDYLSDKYIEVAKYKGLTYTKKSDKVTKDDIESRINAELDARGEEKEVNKGRVKKGDIVSISYKTAEKIKDADNYVSVTVGSGQLPGDMDDKIIGLKVGEEKRITVKLPTDYEDKKVRGKEIIYTVKVDTRTIIKRPSYESLVKELGYNSAGDYEEDLKKTIAKDKKEQNINDAKYGLIYSVIDKSVIKKYPESLVKVEEDKIIKSYKDMANGQNWDDFLKSNMGVTKEEFEKQVNIQARDFVKGNLVVQYIAKKENIKVTDKEYKKALKEILGDSTEEQFKKEYGMTLKEYGKENDLEATLLTNKVSDFIYKNAKEDK